MADGLPQRRCWLIVVTVCLAGSLQAYRVVIGEGGTLEVIASGAWLFVILISGWELYQSRR
jgi:hypothetical protein